MTQAAEVASRSLRWESDERYYIAFIHQDLFGDLVLSRYWGTKGTRNGGEKHERVSGPEALEQRLRLIARDRKRGGYAALAPTLEARPPRLQ